MARDFDGSTQYLSGTNSSALQGNATFTVAALINPDTITGQDMIVGQHDADAGTGWWFRMSDGTLNFTALGIWGENGTATTAVSTGGWVGVAATKSSAANTIIYYRYTLATHVLVSETIDTFTTLPPSACTKKPFIGVQNNTDAAAANWFDGKMARVGVWMGKRLTSDELVRFFLGSPVQQGSINGYWELFGVSSPEPDLSGNNNHMTVNASAARIDHPPGITFPLLQHPHRVQARLRFAPMFRGT